MKHPAEMLFSADHPLMKNLDIKFDAAVDGMLTVRGVAPESFTDCDGVYVHSGFASLLLDTVMGSCVLGELEKMMPIATIKLTCNHLKRMKAGEQVTCEAYYEGDENEIAYVNGKILAGEERELIASAIGTFMIGTTSRRREENA